MNRSIKIPAADPALRFARFRKEIDHAIAQTITAGSYILSKNVEEFENAFSSYLGAKYCIGVNSGTDALSLALMANNIGAGDEVIVPGLTAPGTIIAVLNAGSTPVVVDVNENTLCISNKAITEAISSKTKAIIPVHLHGYAADMDNILLIASDHDLIVIEDCAQAHGAAYNGKKLGSLGNCGAFSFYPTKNLGCMGDGGAVVTNNDEVAEKLYSLRNYGMHNGRVQMPGINSRLDEVQASVLTTVLPHLDGYNDERISYARKYHSALQKFQSILPPVIEGSVYHQFALRVSDRDGLKKKLLDKGIDTGIHYKHTITDHPGLKKYCRDLPQAKKAADSLLSLAIQPEILDEHFDYIIDQLNQFLPQHS